MAAMRRLAVAAVALAAMPLQAAEQGFELAPGVFWVGSAPAQQVATVIANPSGTLPLRPVVPAPVAVAPLPMAHELRLPKVATPSPAAPVFQMPTTFISGPTPIVMPQGQVVPVPAPVLTLTTIPVNGNIQVPPGTTVVIPPGVTFSGNITLTTGSGIALPIGTLQTSGGLNPAGAVTIRR
jgi:hypothetical protein